MKKIIITGGTGLIGSHLVQALQRNNNYELYLLGSKPKNIQTSNVYHIPVDLSQDWDTSLLPAQADAIIHLAQSPKFRDFPGSAEHVFYVNTLSTLKLAHYAQSNGIKNFIYASSAGIYGNSNDHFEETQPIVYHKELGFYLATKHCSEVVLQNYSTLMNVITLRFFFVYGPGQKKDMLIPRLIGFVKDGAPITLQGKEGIKINPTFVGDAVLAIEKCLELNNSYNINVGGGDILSLKEIGSIIARKIRKQPVFINEMDKEVKSLVGDITQMKSLLGIDPMPFEKGIETLLH